MRFTGRPAASITSEGSMAATAEDTGVDEAIAGQQDIDGGEVDAGTVSAPADEIVVGGTAQLDLFNAGGKRPNSATLTIRGRTLEINVGEGYRKGDRLEVTGTIVVDTIGQRDKRDKATGLVTDCVQTHSAFWEDMSIEVVPS